MPEKKREEIQTLLEFKAPLRVYKKRSKKYFTNLSLLVLIIALVLIFLKEFLLVTVLLALLFVTYVNATVEPEDFEHKITNQGLTLGGRTYLWGELSEFWFAKKYDQTVLNIETTRRFPGRLFIVLKGVERDEVKKVLSKFLPFREEARVSFLDKLSEFFSSKLALG